jgi:hypothetical protein
VIVYCRDHGRAIGVVDLNPVGGFPQFHERTPRWRNRHAATIGEPNERSNSRTNLREWTRPVVEAHGCRECGRRMLEVGTLVAAFDRGLAKIAL